MNSPQPVPGPAALGSTAPGSTAPGSTAQRLTAQRLTAQRRNWTQRLVNVLVAIVVIVVAGATFVFSYAGVHAIALLGGVSTQLARYYPGLFDAVLVIACVAALVLRDGHWWARLWAWLVLIIVLGAIGTADVLHAMNYALRHRPTEGVVAAAPVAAVLLAFSLLLTLLRQSRTPDPSAPVATLVDIPALPAAVSVPPIALPAARTVPDTSPASDSPAVAAAPPTVPVPEVEDAPPTVPVPGGSPVRDEAPGPENVTAEDAELSDAAPWNAAPDDEDTASAGPAAQKAHPPTKPNEVIPAATATVAAAAAGPDEPEPPTVELPGATPPPVPQPVPPRSQGIRYAGGTHHAPPPGDYWEAEGKHQFGGLVFRSPDDDDGDEYGAPGNGAAARPSPPELDDDAPPFATAPFASVPRLNRVRSMPTPPEDEDEDEEDE